MTNLDELQQIVERAFDRAAADPTPARWKSVSVLAGCAAVRMSVDGRDYLAAQLEGVADEARRRMKNMLQPDTPIQCGDDYDDVERDHHLAVYGAFK